MSKPLSQMTLQELWQLFPIILTEPQACWADWYAEEKAALERALPGDACIHHIGSTAIPTIWAKPIVDILVEVPKGTDFADIRQRLAPLGYRCMSQSEGRLSFNKGYTPEGFAERVFHLHLRQAGDHDELFFRDYLRAHPDVAGEYERLKRSLWKAFEHDRDGYTSAKTDFVRRYTQLARAEWEQTGCDPLMTTDQINIRDPFVLVHEGKYYLYGTRGATCWGPADGFDVYVGEDLQHWQGPIECFHNDGSFWADRNYWAPEVYAYRGAFYMLASFKKDGVRRGTAILKAQSPLGPFRPHSAGCITPPEWECLDGTLYLSPAGEPYMAFCHEWVQAGDGEVCALRLTDDLSAPVGEPFLLFRASEAPWCKVMHHSSGVSGCVTDGPFFWRTADGTLLCLWASFSQGGYTQAVAVSDNGDITGHFAQADPLFLDDGGHGMVFRALDGQLYLTLHSPNTHLEERPWFHRVEEVDGGLRRARALPLHPGRGQ